MKGKEMNIKTLMFKAGLKLKEMSPDIAFYGGCALIIGGAVLACKQTLKLEEIIDDTNKEHEEIDKYVYAQKKDLKRAHVKANLKLAGKVAKNYAFPVGVAALGFTAVGYSHVRLTHDKKELIGKVAFIENAYNRYRNRVKDEVGEEKENDIYRGLKNVEVTETDSEGKTVKKNFKQQAYDPNDRTAICFCEELCPSVFKGDPILDRNTLINIVRFAQGQYDQYGYLHMKDIYDLFGYYPEVGEYQCRIANEDGYVKGRGSDYIDIGLNDKSNIDMQRFLNGETDAVWIHFNDCGPINKYL